MNGCFQSGKVTTVISGGGLRFNISHVIYVRYDRATAFQHYKIHFKDLMGNSRNNVRYLFQTDTKLHQDAFINNIDLRVASPTSQEDIETFSHKSLMTCSHAVNSFHLEAVDSEV